MNLRKISIMSLAALGLLVTTSCSKTISYTDAIEFVKQHYAGGEATKNASKVTSEFKGKAANDDSKKYLKEYAAAYGYELDDNLYQKKEATDGTIVMSPKCTEDTIKNSGEVCTYSVKGNELTIKESGNMEYGPLSGEGELSTTFNSEGYLREMIEKMSIKTTELDFSYELTLVYTF